MKIFRFSGLLPVLIGIVLLAANISYGQILASPEGKAVCQLNLIPDVTVIKSVNPAYTIYAKAARISTIFTVEVSIDRTGKVTSAKALSGHPWLEEASINAVCQWEFTPIATGDADEKVIGTITFDYFIPKYREQLQRAELEFAKKPDSLEVLIELARAYANNYKNDEAIQMYEKAIQLKPDYSDEIYRELARLYRLYHNDEGYQAILEEGFKVFPVSIRMLEDLAEKYNEVGKSSEAIELYEKVLIIEPDRLYSLDHLADIYQTLLQFEDSLRVLHRIMVIEPDNFKAREKAGFAYLQLRKLDKAEEYLKKSIAMSNEYSSWKYLGDVYEQKGDHQAAIQAWEKAKPVEYQGFKLKPINANLDLKPITKK